MEKKFYLTEKLAVLFFSASYIFSQNLGYPLRWGSFFMLIKIYVLFTPVLAFTWCLLKIPSQIVKLPLCLFTGLISALIIGLTMTDFSETLSEKLMLPFLILAILSASSLVYYLRHIPFEKYGRIFSLSTAYTILNFIRHWLPVFMIIFSYMTFKSLIPVVTHTLYDRELALIDKSLLMNHSTSWFANHIHTACAPALSFGYRFFFILKIIGLSWIYLGISDKVIFRKVTMALLLSYLFGLLLYYLLPSLGPAFAFPQEFSHLPITDMNLVQGNLWNFYRSVQSGPDSFLSLNDTVMKGIAAFPSLHVTITGILMYFLYNNFRKLFWLLTAPVLLLFVSTVYFGWHYVIDDVAGIFLAVLILGLLDFQLKPGKKLFHF